MKVFSTALSSGLILLVFTVGLKGGTVGPDCESCFGGVYTLSGNLKSPSGAGGNETWRITYNLDLAGYNGPPAATYISALAAKVVPAPHLVSSTLVSGPTGGIWTQNSGGLSNAGCKGGGGGWLCLQWISGTQLLVGPATPTYSWIFDVTVKPGTLNTSDASIKANLDPPNGLLLSEHIMLEQTKVTVPEGAAGELPLLLTALALFLIWRKGSELRDRITLGQRSPE